MLYIGLPGLQMEVQIKLAKIQDLDNKISMIAKRMDPLIDEFLRGEIHSEEKKTERLTYIRSLFAKSNRHAKAKEMLAKEMYNSVDKSAHRLDSYLTRYKDEIETRAEIIRNAPDHHSEERRLERDKKEADERKLQESSERKNKEKNYKENTANGHGTDEKRSSQGNEVDEDVDAERININDTSSTSDASDSAINTCMNNMHITEEKKPTFAKKKPNSSGFKDKKSRSTLEKSDWISSASFKRSNKGQIRSQELNNKKLSNSHDHSGIKSKCDSKISGTRSTSRSSDTKLSNGQVSFSESSTNRHNVNNKKSTSIRSASNKKLLSDCVSSDESSDNNHKTENENSTSSSSDKKIIERNKLKKSKSSCSNHKRSVDTSDWALKKANRVKYSNDQKSSSESRYQKETKDAMKRRKSQKSSIINKISGQMVFKKRKVSMSSSEEEFDIPPNPNEPVYCYCQKVSYGDMVACDNDNECEILWFHFGCVGLNSIPIGKWFCTECSKKKRDNRKNVRRSC
ncbi:hypothetical protein TSAR_008963 [Trichomalopsis sarcophagae]|uniref:Inhibitor of growth protein n=1 Tax=Trichomalopsis sarcophagae TaxID=543379 RepID=A0A232EE02_9HYME|nr:hypothetical protein TSAR_008963 [Trichomalopsis sarcophagae]